MIRLEFFIFISYVVFAFFLFLFLNFLVKRFSLSKVEYILFTNVFLVFLAGVASYFNWGSFCDNIFIIVIFEFLIRMLYTTYILEKDFFDREEKNLSLYLEDLIVAYLLNQFIIRQVEMVFLSAEQLKLLLWIFIIFFVYKFFRKQENYAFLKDVGHKMSFSDKKQYIISQYAKMKQRYGTAITVQDDLRYVLYTLMIYENYQRPNFFRRIDYFRYQFDHIPRKQGIMQIDSKKMITDLESIEIVEKKLTKIYDKLKADGKTKKKNIDFGILTIGKYIKNKEEALELEKVYLQLKEFSNL